MIFINSNESKRVWDRGIPKYYPHVAIKIIYLLPNVGYSVSEVYDMVWLVIIIGKGGKMAIKKYKNQIT